MFIPCPLVSETKDGNHVAMMLARISVFQDHPQHDDLFSAIQNAKDAQEAMDIVSGFSF